MLKKLKTGLLAGALAVTSVFSTGVCAACGDQTNSRMAESAVPVENSTVVETSLSEMQKDNEMWQDYLEMVKQDLAKQEQANQKQDESMQNFLKNQEEMLAEQQSRYEELLADQQKRYEELLAEQQTQSSDLQNTIGQLKEKIDELKQLINEQKDMIAEQQTQSDSLQKNIRILQRRINALKQLINEQKEMISAQQEPLQALQQLLDALQAEQQTTDEDNTGDINGDNTVDNTGDNTGDETSDNTGDNIGDDDASSELDINNPTSIDECIVIDNGQEKTYGEAWNEFKAYAEQVRDEKIEYYREKSAADDSTQLIKDSFKVEAAVIIDDERYDADCNFTVLSRIIALADEVNVEFSYYFEARGYTIIELNWFSAQNDVYRETKTLQLVKPTTEINPGDNVGDNTDDDANTPAVSDQYQLGKLVKYKNNYYLELVNYDLDPEGNFNPYLDIELTGSINGKTCSGRLTQVRTTRVRADDYGMVGGKHYYIKLSNMSGSLQTCLNDMNSNYTSGNEPEISVKVTFNSEVAAGRIVTNATYVMPIANAVREPIA